eukprot:4811867-Prorocentrum_lima.AAC.1
MDAAETGPLQVVPMAANGSPSIKEAVAGSCQPPTGQPVHIPPAPPRLCCGAHDCQQQACRSKGQPQRKE